MPKIPLTIPSHTYEPTSDKNIFKFVDRDGNWTHYWIKNKKVFVPAVNHIITTGYPKGERFYNYLLNTSPEQAARRLATSGDEGARTHDAIRDLLEGKTVTFGSLYYNELKDEMQALTYEEWQNLQAFARWTDMYKPQQVFHEYTLWSPKFLYAGTLDFVGVIRIPQNDKAFPSEAKGRQVLMLLDWKTSSGIWEDYELQIAAYRQILFERTPKEIPLKFFNNGIWTGIVRLGTQHKTGFEMRVWNDEESDLNFNLFEAAYRIYKKKGGEVFEPEIENIPIELTIPIPHLSIPKRRPRKK
jgi:hypothetical protein